MFLDAYASGSRFARLCLGSGPWWRLRRGAYGSIRTLSWRPVAGKLPSRRGNIPPPEDLTGAFSVVGAKDLTGVGGVRFTIKYSIQAHVARV